jgi:hypothetical protein
MQKRSSQTWDERFLFSPQRREDHKVISDEEKEEKK